MARSAGRMTGRLCPVTYPGNPPNNPLPPQVPFLEPDDPQSPVASGA